MTYQIKVDYSPVYELVTSLYHYINFKQHRSMRLGKEWYRTTRDKLSSNFAKELEDERFEVVHRINLLVWQFDGERCPEEFLRWLQNQPAGELYERLSPWIDAIPGNLAEIRDRLVYLLNEWNEQYFRTIDPNILSLLQREAGQKEALVNEMSAIDLIEEATNGIRIEPVEGLKTVFLIPQYHCHPATILDFYQNISTCLYPVSLDKADADLPNWELTAIAQAIADEQRLRILRFLYQQPRTFTEVQQHLGLSKSTTHHHLTILRRAGMIRSHYFGKATAQVYSLREQAIEGLSKKLLLYIKS